jgi:hypothetical protein
MHRPGSQCACPPQRSPSESDNDSGGLLLLVTVGKHCQAGHGGQAGDGPRAIRLLQ